MKILDVPQSGSIAGITSSRNRYGQYRRTRAIPVNPNTAAQNEVRTNLALNSVAWRSLDAGTKADWNTYASEHPRTDSLGQTVFITGFQAFVGVNNVLRLLGLPTTLVPPPGGGGETAVINGMSSAGGIVNVNITGLVAANALLIFSSPPRSLGASFNRDYRFLGVCPAKEDEPADDVEIQSLLFAKWGTLAADPYKFFFRFVWQLEGGQGNPFDQTVIFEN